MPPIHDPAPGSNGNGAGSNGNVEDKTRLAVNLYDLARYGPDLRARLLKHRLETDPRAQVWLDKDDPTDVGVPLLGTLLAGAQVIDILRGIDVTAGDPPLRAYIYRGRAWRRILGQQWLTTLTRGRAALCPIFFPGAATGADVCPLPIRPVILTRRRP
jgi:hypothetical protein